MDAPCSPRVQAQDATGEFQLWDEEEVKKYLSDVWPNLDPSQIDDKWESLRKEFGNVGEIAKAVEKKRRDEHARRAALSDKDKQSWEKGETLGSGQDLRSLDLQGLNLSGINLKGADCRGTSFLGAKLILCNLQEAILT